MQTLTATILTPEELRTHPRRIPTSWQRAFGMLKGKNIPDPVLWQRKIRSGWDQRLHRQYQFSRKTGRNNGA